MNPAPPTPAEDGFSERERWLRDAQKAGGVGCFHFDLQAGTWKCTSTMEDIFGIGPDYPKTFPGWLEIIAPEQREVMAEYYAALAASGAPFDKEYRIRRISDGEERWVYGRGEFLRGTTGAPVSLIGTIMDVTSRKREKEKLRLSEEKFSRAFAGAPLIMAISSLEDGRYFDVNRLFCESLGWTREEAIGKTSVALGLIPLEYRARVREELRTTGRVDRIEIPVTTRDGRHLDCIFCGEPIVIEGETRLLSITVDITERKRAEESLRESEAKFAAVFNQAPLLMSISSLEDGRYLDVNRMFCETSGFSRDEVIGKSSIELGWITAGDRDRILEEIRRTGRVSNLELSPTAKDGRPVACLFSGELISVEGKQLLLSIALDVTERSRTEEALRESEARFTLFMEHLPAAAFIKDPEGVTLMANRYLRDLAGGIDMLNRTTAELFPPEVASKMIADDRRALAAGLTVVEETLQDIEGRERHFQTIKFPVPMGGGKTVLGGIAVDITERKQAEEERIRMQEQLNRAQKLDSLGVLAGGIAHDFNNILTAVLGNLSFARRLLGNDHRAAARLAECEKATVRASELTQQLLTFARGGAPVKGTVDTTALLEEVVHFALHGSNVRGVLDLSPGLWCINADEGQVGQLLNNLLINAGQSMPGGGTITIRAGNETMDGNPGNTLPPGRYVAFSVRDEGCGIQPENLARVFDPYFTTKEGGSGLGLASVHSIVRRHGGDVAISSVPGKGTEFIIRLPAAAGEETPGEARHSDAHEALPTGNGRVLVMDDEEMLGRLVTMMLEELGYRAEACSNGSEAVDRYRVALEKGDPFAVVILDLTIPGGLGGKETAARILEIDPGAVLIVSSGYSNDPVLADCAAYGFKGTVAKPYAMETLASEMARLTNPRPHG